MIRIAAGHKVLIAGQNRSGKSTLATGIANAFSRVVVYDPKNDPAAAIPNAAVVTTAREVIRRLPGRILYRPGAEMTDVAARIDEICWALLEAANRGAPPTSLVVHELGDLCTAYRIGPGLSEMIRKGGGLGLTVILVTQRPQGIAVMARSEAQHAMCFTLLDPSDRDTMAALMGPQVRERPLPLDHTFWYRDPDLSLRLMAPVAPVGS